MVEDFPFQNFKFKQLITDPEIYLQLARHADEYSSQYNQDPLALAHSLYKEALSLETNWRNYIQRLVKMVIIDKKATLLSDSNKPIYTIENIEDRRVRGRGRFIFKVFDDPISAEIEFAIGRYLQSTITQLNETNFSVPGSSGIFPLEDGKSVHVQVCSTGINFAEKVRRSKKYLEQKIEEMDEESKKRTQDYIQNLNSIVRYTAFIHVMGNKLVKEIQGIQETPYRDRTIQKEIIKEFPNIIQISKRQNLEEKVKKRLNTLLLDTEKDSSIAVKKISDHLEPILYLLENSCNWVINADAHPENWFVNDFGGNPETVQRIDCEVRNMIPQQVDLVNLLNFLGKSILSSLPVKIAILYKYAYFYNNYSLMENEDQKMVHKIAKIVRLSPTQTNVDNIMDKMSEIEDGFRQYEIFGNKGLITDLNKFFIELEIATIYRAITLSGAWTERKKPKYKEKRQEILKTAEEAGRFLTDWIKDLPLEKDYFNPLTEGLKELREGLE